MINKLKLRFVKLRWENVYFLNLILYAKYLNLWQKYILKDKIKFHVFGDSHIFAFTNRRFKLHYLGPVTAHNLNKINSKSKGKTKLLNEIKKVNHFSKKHLIFVFGEIDCRIHFYNLYKKINKKVSLRSLIRQTVHNYGEVIKQYKQEGYSIIIFNVVPPGEQPNIYNYPFYPTRKKHLEIYLEFNRQLKNFCKKNKLIFIDIFKDLIDKKNNRKKGLILDSIHYNNKVSPLILDFLDAKIKNI